MAPLAELLFTMLNSAQHKTKSWPVCYGGIEEFISLNTPMQAKFSIPQWQLSVFSSN